jgi:xanthine dehydrogenase/oxidase
MWIERIARELGMTPRAVRRVNMYDEGDKTHYGQLLEGCQVKACFEQVCADAALGAQQSCARTHCIIKPVCC